MNERWILTIIVQGIEKNFVFFELEKAKKLFDALNSMATTPDATAVYFDVDKESLFLITKNGLGGVQLVKEWR